MLPKIIFSYLMEFNDVMNLKTRCGCLSCCRQSGLLTMRWCCGLQILQNSFCWRWMSW